LVFDASVSPPQFGSPALPPLPPELPSPPPGKPPPKEPPALPEPPPELPEAAAAPPDPPEGIVAPPLSSSPEPQATARAAAVVNKQELKARCRARMGRLPFSSIWGLPGGSPALGQSQLELILHTPPVQGTASGLQQSVVMVQLWPYAEHSGGGGGGGNTTPPSG
jgi:hypothetical protein